MSREERDSLLSAPNAGAGAPPSAFSVVGFFSHCKAELDYYFFDIHAACRKGDYAALKRFVDTHPDPEILRRMANRLDIINHPPLYEIVMSHRSLGHYACAQLLLRLGADSNFSEKSDPLDSLLRNAIAYSTVEMAALLAQHKAEFKKDSKRSNYLHFGNILTNFSSLEKTNTRLQYGHSASVSVALVLIVTGYALPIRVLLNKTEASEASKSMTTGAGTFAAGFAVASICHWYVSSCIATHQTQLKLMRQILKDKYGLFSEAKAAIIDAGAGTLAASPSNSNPLLTSAAAGSTGAGTGLEPAETASSPGSLVSPTHP